MPPDAYDPPPLEPDVPDPALVARATENHVATEYHDWQGRHVTVSAATLRAVLTAIGVDPDAPSDSAPPSDELRLPECLVVRAGRAERFAVGGPVDSVVAELEDGTSRVVDGDETASVPGTYVLPDDLPHGYHHVVARAGEHVVRGHLIVAPVAAPWPERLGDRRRWGVTAQLYAVRSDASWGVGDLHDLGDLAAWAAARGADFTLINPVHAAEPVPPLTRSPYLPTTRRFPSPLYLRVEDISEHASVADDDRQRIEALAAPLRTATVAGAPIDRDASWSAMREALRIVYAAPRTAERAAAFADFVRRAGADLEDFALWSAYVVAHGTDTVDRPWPDAVRGREPETLAALRAELAAEIDFQRWLQWVLDDQLAAAQARAVTAGMAIGVMHDLAVGVHPRGADVWRLGDHLARGVTVGAPPDAFNQRGQDWSQPPWNPRALARTGYAAWRAVVRAAVRHGGGLRVDHVLGLFRLWLVPEGATPDHGTYLRYDHEALVGVLLLEAARAGAIVIGEDLGTVEPWVRDYLAGRGILGTSLLWFERADVDGHSVPRPAAHWRELALASVGTHDLPPTAGYLDGAHIALRARLGLLTRPLAEEQMLDSAAREQWLGYLVGQGMLRPGASTAEVVRALERFVLSTPARLAGLQLVDLVGDTVIQNQPGTDTEYANWCQPLRDVAGRPVLIADLPDVTIDAR